MARTQLFTNHMHVLSAIAQQPDLRLREIAREVGITERATHRIINDLVDDGLITRTRVGSRNRYEIHPDAALRQPQARRDTAQIIRLLTGPDEPNQPSGDPTAEPVVSALPGSDMFREAFAAAPAGIVIAEASGRILAVNPAFCAILRAEPPELIGHSFREFTHPDDIAADDERLSKLAAGQPREYEREKRYIRQDGTSTWVRFRVAAMTDPATESQVFVAHVTDISAGKRHERALAEAEERFRSAFDNAPIGMALVAPDGRWLKVNRALLELTGYSETALLVRSFQSITHPDDLDADVACVADVLAGRRRTYQLEKRYYHADGGVIWTMLSVSLVRDTAGSPLYFISQIEDITERRRREQDLTERRQREQARPRQAEPAGSQIGQ